MTPDEIKAVVADPASFAGQAFDVLREIAMLYARADDAANEEGRQVGRDLIIRCLERRDEMGEAAMLHDALLVQIGLFPYIETPEDLPLADRLILEAHRPLVEPRDAFVFHEMQAQVYARLMDGENVILTAPTSFGKTLIVDALIASGEYGSVVVVVPTIALIDEVRRRLSRLNKERELGYRIISHPGQTQGDRNIFVFTQERLLEEPHLPAVDLGVIDEFYKLSLGRDQDRATLLNLALAKLRRKAKQLYLLGPSVGELNALPPGFEYRYIPSLDSTVAVDLIRVRRSNDERADLLAVCADLAEPTLIYVRTPARAHEVARWLVDAGVGSPGLPEAARWVASNYHPDWVLVRSLNAGIGIHHGRIPRALAHYMVSAFNEERLRFLICTQTLIEGVNTTAKNILIVDDQIVGKKLDLFTFRNIQGRAGRMFNHYVGRVYLFNEAPQDCLPAIDIPALSQPEGTPAELLLGLNEDELEPRSKERIAPYLEQDLLSIEVLRENSVDPDAQLALAQALRDDAQHLTNDLAWHGFPTYEQLKATVDLLWRHFPNARRGWGARSSAQLTQLINQAARGSTQQMLIANQAAYWLPQGRGIDEVVLDVLTFYRSGLSFGLPKYLRVLDAIQRDVFDRLGLPVGDYRQYAAAAEGVFMPQHLAALDEYGIPIELARKLQHLVLPRDATLDDVIERLRQLDPARIQAEPFEIELLRETQEGL